MPGPVHERLELSLYTVDTSPYDRLDIVDLVSPYWIASAVVSGQVVTQTRGLRWDVGPGDVMVHPPNIPFSESASVAGVHQWCAFTAAATSPGAASPVDLLLRNPLSPVVRLAAHRDEYARTFDALETEWKAAEETRDDLLVAGLLTVLLRLLSSAWRDQGAEPRPESLQPSQGRFADLRTYMEANLGERITRDDLARRACLHPGSLDRAFRAVYGEAPMRLLQSLRLAQARRLLETTDDTLDAVARSVGLGDAARFSRLFRARFGIAPGAYRERSKPTTIRYISPL